MELNAVNPIECSRTISEEMEIDFEEVEELKEIGRGSFGVVYRGVWRSKVVAVKKINTAAEQKAFMIEVRQLSRVSHPNIVKLYGASTRKPVCLIMELAEASLFDVLHCHSKISYTFHHAMNWALQCARGVAYLHGIKPRAIIHRDLKPPNLLLMMEGRVLKICDFGTACDIRTHMTNSQGSAAWMAPEVFEGNHYSEKCDVFSWSIILWELIARQKPFSHITDSALAIMWAVHTGKRPPLIRGCPVPLEKLMTSCWDQNPKMRPSMELVVKEMSHLFQFFPEEVSPLEYPDSIDLQDNPDASTGSYDTRPSQTNSSGASAMLTSLPVPTTDYRYPSTGERTVDNPPSLNHMTSNSSAHEPLHLIIGEENEESAEGYHIPRLDDDFLSGNSRQPPQQPFHPSEQAAGPSVIPRRPPKSHPLFKRRSAEFPSSDGNSFSTPPAAAPQPVLPPGWSAPVSHGPASSKGHRRSASHGNPTQLWAGITQQQSMPCITNLPSEPMLYSPRTSFGETANHAAGGEQPLDDIFSLLHPSLRPVPPCPTSQVSMRVYEDHRKMAKEYLEVQKELQWMSKYCIELADHLEQTKKQQRTSQQPAPALEPAELQRSVEEFVQLENEKKSLVQLHRSLREQLNRSRSEQQNPSPPPDRPRSPPLADGGWVVLSRT